MKKKERNGVLFDDLLKEELKEPDIRSGYEVAKAESLVAKAICRLEAGRHTATADMHCRSAGAPAAMDSANRLTRGLGSESFGDAEEFWPSFNDREVVSPCEGCGTAADDRPRWKDESRDCPDCGADITGCAAARWRPLKLLS